MSYNKKVTLQDAKHVPKHTMEMCGIVCEYVQEKPYQEVGNEYDDERRQSAGSEVCAENDATYTEDRTTDRNSRKKIAECLWKRQKTQASYT